MNRAYDTRKPYYASCCVIFTCACDGDDINCYISYVSTIHTDAMWLLFPNVFPLDTLSKCVRFSWKRWEFSIALLWSVGAAVHRRKIRLQSERQKVSMTSRFAQLEVFSLNFSNSSLEIRANLLHPSLWFIIISLVLFHLNLLLFSCFYLGQNFSKLSSRNNLFCSGIWCVHSNGTKDGL